MNRRLNYRTPLLICFGIYLIWATFPREPNCDVHVHYSHPRRSERFSFDEDPGNLGDMTDEQKVIVTTGNGPLLSIITLSSVAPDVLADRKEAAIVSRVPITALPTTVTNQTTHQLLAAVETGRATPLLITATSSQPTKERSSSSPSLTKLENTNRTEASSVEPKRNRPTVGLNSRDVLPLCPDPSPNLLGHLNVSFDAPIVDQISNNSQYPLNSGGMFRPRNCTSHYGRVAIVVPYRSRQTHLTALLNHLHPILQRQLLNYAFIVVEQAGTGTFNKALLMNAAYKESQQLVDPNDLETQFQCYIFHDVDLFTEDDRGTYACRDFPMHLSELVDKMNYRPFPGRDILFGGVVSVPRRHFELVNGYSNIFFGWGGEDDEMRQRFKLRGIPVLKATTSDYYRYKMFRHYRDRGNTINRNRSRLIEETPERMYYDGLSSLTYRLVARTDYQAYTHFLVQFTEDEVMNKVFGAIK